MTKRLQVLFEDDEYEAIQATARKQRVTVASWVRTTLRNAQFQRALNRDGKLRVISSAIRHEFPTSDIDQMLSEIATGLDSE